MDVSQHKAEEIYFDKTVLLHSRRITQKVKKKI